MARPNVLRASVVAIMLLAASACSIGGSSGRAGTPEQAAHDVFTVKTCTGALKVATSAFADSALGCKAGTLVPLGVTDVRTRSSTETGPGATVVVRGTRSGAKQSYQLTLVRAGGAWKVDRLEKAADK
jgi:hypothetical protein